MKPHKLAIRRLIQAANKACSQQYHCKIEIERWIDDLACLSMKDEHEEIIQKALVKWKEPQHVSREKDGILNIGIIGEDTYSVEITPKPKALFALLYL